MAASLVVVLGADDCACDPTNSYVAGAADIAPEVDIVRPLADQVFTTSDTVPLRAQPPQGANLFQQRWDVQQNGGFFTSVYNSTDRAPTIGAGTLPPGPYRVILDATLSTPSQIWTSWDTVAFHIDFVPTTGPSGSIIGTVTVGGQPRAGVVLTLSGGASATTTSVANGGYAFTNLVQGEYTVTVTPPTGTTFADPTRTVVVLSGQTVVVDFAGT